MKTINLRDIYPLYDTDCFMDVADEVADIFEDSRRAEAAYQRRLYRNKAHFSLDRNDGIEHEILFVSMSPYEIYERNVSNEQLHAAITALPNTQAKRIYAHYFLGMSKTAIAIAEGVSKMAVCSSIMRGLQALERELKKLQD